QRGQIPKLRNPANHGGDMFLLSWTLTQSDEQAVACVLGGGVATTILDLARGANAALRKNMVPALLDGTLEAGMRPNLIYIDWVHGFATDFALWANQAMPTTNVMKAADNGFLTPGMRIFSPNGAYYLTYQANGALTLWASNPRRSVWTSNTRNKGAWRTYMQSDGNFVIYDAPGRAFWGSGTHGNPNAIMAVQDDGHFAILRPNGTVITRFPS
ncbi:MAG TPA: hypothetical protein VFV07_13210, partial [Rhizomicrobium sp.]|nr:hypothetical protein [Rhizomicrobium sp.]